jgi:hypothetical protein
VKNIDSAIYQRIWGTTTYEASLKNQAGYIDMDLIRKSVWAAMEYIAHLPKKNLDNNHVAYSKVLSKLICDFIGKFTPREFMEMFPVDKRYNGKKCNCKDYFTTIEMLKKYPSYRPIRDNGKDAAWEFMCDYQNLLVRRFMAQILYILLKGWKRQHNERIFMKFCRDNGIVLLPSPLKLTMLPFIECGPYLVDKLDSKTIINIFLEHKICLSKLCSKPHKT